MKGIQELRFVRINSDADDHTIDPERGEYRMTENLAPPQKGKGRGFSRESLKGTIQATVTDPEYPTTLETLGSYEDKPTEKNYFFVWASSDFHRIMEYDQKTQTVNRVIRSSKFPWTPDTQITGIKVVDNVIYWTDPVLSYYRIEDQSQLAEIDYNCNKIATASPITYQFVAEFQSLTDVNFQVSITGPLSAVEIAQAVAAAMNADPGFTPYFTANVAVGASVIKIKAKSEPGSIKLVGSPTAHYNYYQTNFDVQPASPEDFYLYPRPPMQRPNIFGFYDASITINKILNKNWQFTVRQVYLNNQITVFSPFSEIYPAARFPENVTDTAVVNLLLIEFTVTKPERVKFVEIAARTSEDGDWFIIKTIPRSELFGTGGVFYYSFSGSEQQIAVDAADAIKQQEGTPRQSNDMQFQKNKIFAIDNLTGFDYDASEMSLTAEIGTEELVASERYYKEGGLYNVAARFFDGDFQTDGTVHREVQVNIPEQASTSYQTNPTDSGKGTLNRQYLNVTLAGKPPVWAEKFIIVRSDELRYGLFAQVHCYVHYYVRPQIESDIPTNGVIHYYMNGNKYREAESIVDNTSYRYLHLMLPTNLNIVPERGMIVQVLAGNNVGGPEQFTILDVQGNMMVLDQPVNLTNSQYPVDALFVEIYNPKTVTETDNFYEVTESFDIVNPGLDTRAFPAGPIKLYGDVYNTNNEDELLQWKYDWDDYIKNESTEEEKGLRKDKYMWAKFEAYTLSFSPTQVQAVETFQERQYVEYDYDFGYISSVELKSRNLGRPAPLLQNVREESRPSTIRFTNDYIENATINGLHTFEPLNIYPLPIERGPIVKLQSAGEDVMLAIHSSGVTSMYVGKGIIRSADLNPTLVTTENVIGTDNQLKYSFGTVHASSVCEVDGNVYFWDGNRNEPVRYAQNGLVPLASRFSARTFFKDTIPSVFGTTDQYDCIAQYDRLLDMVFFMFKNETTSLTIGFRENDNVWIGKFGFTPDYFGVIGDDFLGFVNGRVWIHNQDNNNYNTFYGTTYPSKGICVMNLGESYEVSWDSLMLNSNIPWDIPILYNYEGQVTNLLSSDFRLRDNMYYADLLRDINTPPEKLKPGQIALRHGNPMSSQTIAIEFEVTSSDYHYLDTIGIGGTIKAGHFIQNNKSG